MSGFGTKVTFTVRGITFACALVVAFGLQVDTVGLVNRLSMDERLRTLELRIEHFENRVNERLVNIETHLGSLSSRTAAVEDRLVELNTRVDTFSDDNRQRFRVLTERVSAIERLVA